MRLKALPEDFKVFEQLVYPRVEGGPYFVHLLRKRKLDTHSALNRVAKLAQVSRDAIAFAGLKDRQAITEQWISIKGKRIDYRDATVDIRFVDRSDRPITSHMSDGNAFEIVLRELDGEQIARLRSHVAQVRDEGLPNYFDDQRFGCLVHGQGFVMPAVLRRDFATALRQLVAQPSPKAVTGDVKLKRLLERHWGDWEACASFARGPVYGRLFNYLVDRPDDYEGALRLVPTKTKLIHAYAYQSWVWNRAVDGMLHRMLPRRRVGLPNRSGRLVAWDGAPAALIRRLEEMRAPLFAPDGVGGDSEFEAALLRVLDDQGFARRFEAPQMPGMQLREEERSLVVRPRDLVVSDGERDELVRGFRKVKLSFALPRGAYATLLVKRLMAEALAPRRARPTNRFNDRRPSAKTRSHEDP